MRATARISGVRLSRSTAWTALLASSLVAAIAGQFGGCPPQSPSEFIAGGTGDQAALATTASVTVFAPVSDLALAGGTPVEIAWRAVATTRIATIDVFVDLDSTPDSGNETVLASNLPLTQTSQVIDTSRLDAADYFLGVLVRELGEIAAVGYAPGQITINQASRLFFTSPRDNFTFDRTSATTPRFDVAWTVTDPDSVVSVRILLDPDSTPNGNEILLRESNSQSGDSFTFDLPTASFDSGTYRLLALISDGVDTFSTYAPGSIRLRSRLAGIVDLRNMDIPEGGISGAVFEGFNPRDNAGSLVISTKDVDGDGFDDFLISSQFGKPQYQSNNERTGVGEAYLIYGRPSRYSGKLNLNSTGRLFRGEIYGGVPELPDPIRPSRGITSFCLLSDWDGDGLREFAFGLPFTDSLPAGLLGAGVGTIASDVADLTPLDPTGYFRTGSVVIASSSSLRPDLGFPGQNVFNLAEFGTVSHMPQDCVACGAIFRVVDNPCPCPEGFYGPKAPPTLCDSTSYHRHLTSVAGTPNIGSVRLGCRISTADFGDQCGETIAAGDFDSIIISVPNRDPATNVFTIAARNQKFPGAGVVSQYFVIRADTAGGLFCPWSTNQGPPSNTDNNYPGMQDTGGIDNLLPHGGPYHYILDDLRLQPIPGTGVSLIATPGYTVDPDDSDQPCETIVESDTPLPSRTTRIYGGFNGARIGEAFTVADFNADGLQETIIGSPLSNEGAGSCFIILGRLRDLVMAGELALEELGLPLNSSNSTERRIFDGIRVIGSPGDRLGQSQASAGDFNGDGISDIAIGSPFVNNRAGGAAVFFGSREVINLTQSEIPFDELPSRGLGVIFVGEKEGDLVGARVTGCGDIDGDGLDDILIAAPDKSVQLDTDLDGVLEIDRTNCGVVYLVYGSSKLRGTMNLSQIGTEALPGAVFVGRESGAFLGAGLGEQGDRSRGIAGAGDVDGDGRADLLLGSVSASPRDRVRAGEAYLLYGVGD